MVWCSLCRPILYRVPTFCGFSYQFLRVIETLFPSILDHSNISSHVFKAGKHKLRKAIGWDNYVPVGQNSLYSLVQLSRYPEFIHRSQQAQRDTRQDHIINTLPHEDPLFLTKLIVRSLYTC